TELMTEPLHTDGITAETGMSVEAPAPSWIGFTVSGEPLNVSTKYTLSAAVEVLCTWMTKPTFAPAHADCWFAVLVSSRPGPGRHATEAWAVAEVVCGQPRTLAVAVTELMIEPLHSIGMVAVTGMSTVAPAATWMGLTA